MMENWKQWASEFLVVLKDEDQGERAAKLKELEVALQTEAVYLALRPVDLSGPLEAAEEAQDSGAALDVLRSRLSLALMPLKNWHGKPQPDPVLWRAADSEWADAVLSAGEVALLSGQGGIGKSYLSLQWALAATRNETGGYGEDCGLRVQPGPVVILSYEDAPVRMAKRIEDLTDTAAPDGLFVLPAPEPLWKTKKGESTPGIHWTALWQAVARIGASLVIIDPASAALEGATNDSGPVRRFMDELRRKAETSGAGVLVVAHDTKSARNEAKAGGDPGAGAVAGSAAWFDACRGVLYLRPDPVDRDRWLLECTKANYGRTGWGERLIKAKTHAGKFCGFSESGPALSAGEVEDLKAAWRNQVNNQTRKRKKTNKTSGKAQAAGERNPY